MYNKVIDEKKQLVSSTWSSLASLPSCRGFLGEEIYSCGLVLQLLAPLQPLDHFAEAQPGYVTEQSPLCLTTGAGMESSCPVRSALSALLRLFEQLYNVREVRASLSVLSSQAGGSGSSFLANAIYGYTDVLPLSYSVYLSSIQIGCLYPTIVRQKKTSLVKYMSILC